MITKWVPLADRKPRPGQFVWIWWAEKGAALLSRHVVSDGESSWRYPSTDTMYAYPWMPSHWMPLAPPTTGPGGPPIVITLHGRREPEVQMVPVPVVDPRMRWA